MQSPLRAVVWLAVVAASVAVGWYISQAPEDGGLAQAPKSPGSYAFLAGGADPYWELCIAGAEDAAKQLGAELEVFKPVSEGEDGLREQLGWLTSLDGDKYDGLALGPIDPERQTTQLNAMADKLTLVTIDSDAPGSKRMCYIGSSNHEAGGMAAKMVKEALPNGGKVVVLLASLAKTNAAERKAGFDEELLGSADDPDAEQDQASLEDSPQYEVVDYLMDLGNPDTCAENLRKACAESEDLGVIVGTFGYHAPTALAVLEELGKDIPVIAFDEHEQTLAGIESGAVHATIVQNPYMFGAEAIRMLDQVRTGQFLSLPVGAQVNVGVHCKVVKRDSLDEFKAGLKQTTE